MAKTLLFDEYPLVLSPTLITLLGFGESAIIQQIHYQIQFKEQDPIRYKDHFFDGFYWVIYSYQEWQFIHPYLGSTKTIQRMVNRMIDLEIIVVRKDERAKYNEGTKRYECDHRYWYRIDYEAMNKFVEDHQKVIDEIGLRQRVAKKNYNRQRTICPQTPGQNVQTPQDKLSSTLTESLNQISQSGILKDTWPDEAGPTVPDKKPKKKKPKADPEVWADRFEKLWKLMPVGRKDKKSKAFSCFLSPTYMKKPIPLTDELYDQIYAKLKLYADEIWKYTELQYVPHFSSWYNDSCFMTPDEEVLAMGKAQKAKYDRIRQYNGLAAEPGPDGLTNTQNGMVITGGNVTGRPGPVRPPFLSNAEAQHAQNKSVLEQFKNRRKVGDSDGK